MSQLFWIGVVFIIYLFTYFDFLTQLISTEPTQAWFTVKNHVRIRSEVCIRHTPFLHVLMMVAVPIIYLFLFIFCQAALFGSSAANIVINSVHLSHWESLIYRLVAFILSLYIYICVSERERRVSYLFTIITVFDPPLGIKTLIKIPNMHHVHSLMIKFMLLCENIK